MSDDLVIIPSDGTGYVELARTKTGRLFRKHLLNIGPLHHPKTGETINIDQDFVTALKRNFDAGVCDIVQVPLADKQNEHTEAPDRNIGEVVDLQFDDKKVYAVIDVRDAAHADKVGKTYLGASAMLHMNYTDTKTGKKVGPTLLHSCVTNRPYVTGLEPYEEIVAATTDRSGQEAVLLTTDTIAVPDPSEKPTKEPDMPETEATQQPAITPPTVQPPSLDELLTTLKAQHNIDVPALQSAATRTEAAAVLSNTLAKALSDAGVITLTAGQEPDTVSTEDVVGAVSELASSHVTLTNRVNGLERRDAQHAVDGLISEGKILPAQRGAFVELKLTNPAMFDQLIPAEPIIKLNAESGVTPPDDTAHTQDIDAEIARLSGLLAPVKP